MFQARFLLPALAAMAGLLSTAAAEIPEQGIPILRLPYTITKPGVYVVRRDLVYKSTTGAAITINADNVILDLGGRTLSYTPPATVPPPTGNGVETSGHNSITVRHGTLAGFVIGIKMNPYPAPGRILVEEVECAACVKGGLQLDSAESLEVRNCRIHDTGADSNPETQALFAVGKYVRLTGNVVTNTMGKGSTCRALTTGGLTTLVADNQLSNPTQISDSYGIIVFNSLGSATNNENFVKNNSVAGFGNGIGFVNGATGKYQDNLTANCAVPFSGGSAVGTNN